MDALSSMLIDKPKTSAKVTHLCDDVPFQQMQQMQFWRDVAVLSVDNPMTGSGQKRFNPHVQDSDHFFACWPRQREHLPEAGELTKRVSHNKLKQPLLQKGAMGSAVGQSSRKLSRCLPRLLGSRAR